MKAYLRKHNGESILFFPDVEADEGYVMSYEKIGQHSEASIDFMYETKPSKSWDLVEHYEKHYDCKLNIIEMGENASRCF